MQLVFVNKWCKDDFVLVSQFIHGFIRFYCRTLSFSGHCTVYSRRSYAWVLHVHSLLSSAHVWVTKINFFLCTVQYSALGYNDFNNLVMQTLWWLPNKILGHIHKKRFSVFLSRFLRICNQSVQQVLIRAKQCFLLKNSIWVSKNTEFHADFESVENFLKKCTQKSYLQKCDGNMHFFHFYLCSSNLFCL